MAEKQDDQFLAPWLAPMTNAAEQFKSLQEQFLGNFQNLFGQASQGGLPEIKDRRFSSDAWKANPQLLTLAHMYLLSSKAMQDMVEKLEVEPAVKERLKFYSNQWIDAIAPSNFFALNADALKAFQDTKGESFQKGMANFIEDTLKGRITQTDESVFTVGENLAVTPGKVVFKNALFELIQYTPQTTDVFETPLLLVPPCINKFYILDLQPENSFVNYSVQQGHTVFLVSWRNPIEGDADRLDLKTWDDYIDEGVLTAINTTREITGKDKINALGFCVGGTMLSTALAVARARGEDPVNSLTLLTTFLDFSETGVMDVFIDEASVAMREATMGHGGLMSGQDLATTFSFLRPNELVWNYVVNNYFKGETPMAFDILYWNADSTNLPGPFYAWYLRNTYLENNLVEPNKAVVLGTPVDLGRLDMDTYIYASKEDHIVPWQSAYMSNDVVTGKKRFCLGASGHVAGVINPPAKNKRNYWVNDNEYDDGYLSNEQWFEESQQKPGSWWVDWSAWLAERAGAKIKAKKTLGNTKHKPTTDAPGEYVKVRAVK